MPNLSAAKKSLRADERKRVYNLRRSRDMKEQVKLVTELLQAGQVADARESLPTVFKAIDKAVKRGVIKANTAARKKSLLARTINQAEAK
jgi:small subunit ribosomal protein S20